MATFIPITHQKKLLKTCPYNPSHKIAPSRFDIHLYKCAKTSTVKLEICPYYNSHRYPKELMPAHIVECEYAASDICRMVENEKTEWDKLEDVKPKASEVAELAGRMGAMGLGPQPAEPAPGPKDEASTEIDEWATTPNQYVIPGLEGGKPKVTTAYGPNLFFYQSMTPAERRKFNEKLVLKAINRKERHDNKELVDKEKELREKREKEKKEEEERIQKEKEERERVKMEREAKQKAKKDKIKAAKRAAFLARQADGQNAEQSNEE